MCVGEASYERPEIMDYTPPAGRTELGNIDEPQTAESLLWKMLSDNKGRIYFYNKETGEKSYTPPDAFRKILPGKSAEVLVGEAAALVLSYIKGKITRHIDKKKKIMDEVLHPLSIAEKKKIAKAKERERQLNGGLLLEDLMEKPKDPDERDDLSKYQYDIETVEMLASAIDGTGGTKVIDPDGVRAAKIAFLKDSDVRTFDESLYTGPRMVETDVDELTQDGMLSERNSSRLLLRFYVLTQVFGKLLSNCQLGKKNSNNGWLRHAKTSKISVSCSWIV
jgi:hypothetical protein